MLSFDKWKKLNENVGSPTVLGLGQKHKVADLQKRWDEMGNCSYPMKSKKMFGDMPSPEAGDEHLPLPKKGKKKMPPMPPEGDMEDADMDMDDAEGDMDDADMDMDDAEGDADMDDMDDADSDMDDAEGDMDDADADVDDAEGDMDDADADMDMPAPPIKGKGKMPDFLNKTKAVADGAKLMHKGASKMVKGMKENALTKEEKEFWKSLKSQTGSCQFVRDQDGDFVAVEDAIIPPSNPNANIIDDEPKAGEVGYAPSGKIGSLGTFAEWAAKHKGRKINESANPSKKKKSKKK